jgi:hypothetical protein
MECLNEKFAFCINNIYWCVQRNPFRPRNREIDITPAGTGPKSITNTLIFIPCEWSETTSEVRLFSSQMENSLDFSPVENRIVG